MTRRLSIGSGRARQRLGGWRARWPLFDVVAALALLAVVTAVMFVVRDVLNVLNVSLFYLLLVLLVALVAPWRISIAVAIVAFLLFDLLFILPYYSLTVARADHVLALFVFMLVAALTSWLVTRVRERTLESLERGHQMETLYELSQALIGDIALQPMLGAIVDRVVAVLGVRGCAVLLPDDDGRLLSLASAGAAIENDETLARWAFERGEVTGTGTPRGRVVAPTLAARRRQTRPGGASLPVLYLPIASAGRAIGVLRVSGPPSGRFGTADQQLLATFANQAALAIERVRLSEEATRASVLAKSDELKSALLSAVSHDLRTPLASIKASATSLLQEDVNWSKEDERDLLQAIDEETDRLARIVGNLLDLSRIEAGVLRPHRDWYALREVVHESIERTRATVAGRELRVDLPDSLPETRFDYVEIVQVLINLIENAARYAPPDTPIEVDARHDGAMIAVSVADRGPGLPAGEEERIFEKFYRLREHQRLSGTGIGLSICRGFIEAHGGRIWASPREGGGAVFTFTLPVERAGASAELPAEPRAEVAS